MQAATEVRLYLTLECDAAHISLSDFSLARLTASFSGMLPDISMQRGTLRSSGEHTMPENPCSPIVPSPIQACRSRREPREQTVVGVNQSESIDPARAVEALKGLCPTGFRVNGHPIGEGVAGVKAYAKPRAGRRSPDGRAELLETGAERPAGTGRVLEQ